MEAEKRMSRTDLFAARLLVVWMLLIGCGAHVCRKEANQLRHIARDVRYYYDDRKHYPRFLAEACRDPRWGSYSACAKADSWGRPYSYRRVPGGFMLFSNGPDGRPWTDDDLVWSEPVDIGGCLNSKWSRLLHGCLDNNCRCEVTASELLILEYDVGAFRLAKGRYPEDLAEVNVYLRGNPERFGRMTFGTDRWGVPWQFTVGPCGFQLSSAGPDRVAGTDDDIFPGAISRGCLLAMGKVNTGSSMSGEPAEAIVSGEATEGSGARFVGDNPGELLAEEVAPAEEAHATQMPVPRKLPSGCGCSFVGR